MRKRVVVTGMGTVNPVGNGVEAFWSGIKQGKSGIGPITRFDASQHTTQIAAEIKNFKPSDYMDSKDARKMETFSHYAVASALEAWKDSGLGRNPSDSGTLGAYEGGLVDPERLGVILGVGMGGFETVESSFTILKEKGPSRVPPLTVPKIISNIGPGNIAIMLNAQGPSYSLATACASGTDAIGNGYRLIVDDICDAVVTGGVEAIITPLGIAGFNVIHALSTKYNDEPQKASRPFDKDRDGFVMGEGAAILILEELNHALERGAKIYGEVVGVGASSDASHITAPHPEGRGAIQAIKFALRMAGLQATDIDYINAHGTGTQINDVVETKVIHSVFGDAAKDVKISSTKSMTGHCIGAAGGIEAVVCVKALQDQFYPATINLDTPDEECDLNYIPHTGFSAPMKYAMSNSLGFGGHNGILIFKKYE